MVRACLLVVLLAPFSAFASHGLAAEPDWSRARYGRITTQQNAFTQSRLMEHGLTPLWTLQTQRRQVRQAIFSDPYMMMRLPAVEIERRRDGVVTLVVRGPNRVLEPVVLPPSAWAELMQSEQANPDVFGSFGSYETWKKRVKAAQRSTEPMPHPPPICHAWGVTIGSTGREGVRFGGAGGCGGDREKMAHVALYARLAVSTRPACVFKPDNPFWSFRDCFAAAPSH